MIDYEELVYKVEVTQNAKTVDDVMRIAKSIDRVNNTTLQECKEILKQHCKSRSNCDRCRFFNEDRYVCALYNRPCNYE